MSTLGYFMQRNESIQHLNRHIFNMSQLLYNFKITVSQPFTFYCNINSKNTYPSVFNTEYDASTIYMGYIVYCKFNSILNIPTYLHLVCNAKPPDINPKDSFKTMIQKLKSGEKQYTASTFTQMIQLISRKNIMPFTIHTEVAKPNGILRLLHLLKDIPDLQLFKSAVKWYIQNNDIRHTNTDITNNTSKFMDQLWKDNNTMRDKIGTFISNSQCVNQKTMNSINSILKKLSTWNYSSSPYVSANAIANFYKMYIQNFINIFPSIIQRTVSYSDVSIPAYYKFTEPHAAKLKTNIDDYYKKLYPFQNKNGSLDILFVQLREKCSHILLLINETRGIASIFLSNNTEYKGLIHEDTLIRLYEYYLLYILKTMVELTDTIYDDVTDQHRQFNHNVLALKQNTCRLLVEYINIMQNDKKTINLSYTRLQDIIFKSKEAEKDRVLELNRLHYSKENDIESIDDEQIQSHMAAQRLYNFNANNYDNYQADTGMANYVAEKVAADGEEVNYNEDNEDGGGYDDGNGNSD